MLSLVQSDVQASLTCNMLMACACSSCYGLAVAGCIEVKTHTLTSNMLFLSCTQMNAPPPPQVHLQVLHQVLLLD